MGKEKDESPKCLPSKYISQDNKKKMAIVFISFMPYQSFACKVKIYSNSSVMVL